MTSTSNVAGSGFLGWLAGFRIYRDPKVLAILFLGFSSGLPFALVAGTLAAWLTKAEVSMTEVGMFAWVGILYAFKFIWAPLVDQLSIPILTNALGRRRSWMLVGQIGVALALFGMANSDPRNSLFVLASFAVAAGFFSATQDIAVDAWRIEAVDTDMQAAMAASYQLGYRVAFLLSTAFALTIADSVGWPTVYSIMALLMGVGMMTVMLIREPRASIRESSAEHPSLLRDPGGWVAEAVVEPFADFFRRYGREALMILVFIGVYRISDTVMGLMANPFYLTTGFTQAQVGLYAKAFGFFPVIAGAALGGVAVVRHGLGGPLVFGAVILAITNLSFAVLALVGPSIPALVVTILADNLAQGFTGTVFIAYLSSLTNTSHTATQYALFTSLMVLPGKFLSGFSGFIVDEIGWFSFFIYASFMGIPAILLAIWIRKRLD
jgi:PAT family beta-lactamase induction signal transducer AmpG